MLIGTRGRHQGLAGWLLRIAGRTSQNLKSPTRRGTTIKQRFNNTAATANGFRSSRARRALVSRYIVRRAGVVA